MNRSVKEGKGGCLVVSQFTLYGNCLSGRRPDFLKAAKGELAESLYEAFVACLRLQIEQVATGSFGAKMEVELVNDGPVTLLIDTP